jgi:transcriptional regulator with XRE-family HTH domain
MTIGSNLKALRKRKKLSQEEVAKALSLFRSTYSGYENGVAQPNLENLLLLSDFYQVSTDFLLRENFEKFIESDTSNSYNDIQTRLYKIEISLDRAFFQEKITYYPFED